MTTLKELKADPCFVDAWHPSVLNSAKWFWETVLPEGTEFPAEQKIERYLDHFRCQPVWTTQAVWAKTRNDEATLLGDHEEVYLEDDDAGKNTFLAGIIFDNQQDHLMFLIKWGKGGEAIE